MLEQGQRAEGELSIYKSSGLAKEDGGGWAARWNVIWTKRW